MASNYHIEKPYVLATLPRSLARPDSRCVVGDVYGQKAGAKKRRRPEVAVGIDGEAANLYDIASSRLITSYPVPPQATFSCPPCSLRLRSAAGKKADVARYTYISTREPARKLSLFRDTVGASGATASATVSTSLGRSGSPVVYLTTSSSSSSNDGQLVAPDLLAVSEDGEVTFFDGETLEEKHKVSVAALSQDLQPRGSALRVELAQTAQTADVLKGLQLGEDYLSGVLAQKVDAAAGGFNPDVLLLITATADTATRYLHVLVVDPGHSAAVRLVQVHHIRLPSSASETTSSPADHKQPLFRLDVASGSLFALDGETVVSYDLARSVPRIIGHMSVPGATSFLQLSKSSILASTATTFSVYNPVFSSLQASTPLDLAKDEAQLPPRRSCAFVSYFSQLELAVALVDAHYLVAVQLEPPRTRSKKRRADGLLIDSIGRGVSWKEGQGQLAGPEGDDAVETLSGRKYVPGTVSAAYLQQYNADVLVADRLLADGDVAAFDDFLAEKLSIQNVADWRWQRPLDAADGAEAVNEAQTTTNGAVVVAAAATTSTPTTRVTYPEADRRWVVYAIGRVLAVDQAGAAGRLRLRCALPESDIVNYLVDAGHLSVANVRSALRSALQGVDDADAFLGEALPVTLAHVDPSLDLLLRWLYATQLAATELLSAILLLMRSLELVAAAEAQPEAKLLLLTNGTDDRMEDGDDDQSNDVDNENDNDDGGELPNQELDRLDQQLCVAEYFLEHVENDPRDLALDIAIGKLGSCPAVATVLGLRRIFRTDEIRSLIEVLRKQLVDQGWATRYVDMEGSDSKDGATPLNYSIRLIADLLGRCIDSVRPGEWLVDDAATAAAAAAAAADREAEHFAIGSVSPVAGDFFASLKWQVSAALEGVQEALYLRGILGEAVRYATGVQSAAAASASAAATTVAVSSGESAVRPTRLDKATLQAAAMLPLGLKAPTGLVRYDDVTPTKIVSGGEVVKRSRREIGHLTSQKVGAYTLERIVL